MQSNVVFDKNVLPLVNDRMHNDQAVLSHEIFTMKIIFPSQVSSKMQ